MAIPANRGGAITSDKVTRISISEAIFNLHSLDKVFCFISRGSIDHKPGHRFYEEDSALFTSTDCSLSLLS